MQMGYTINVGQDTNGTIITNQISLNNTNGTNSASQITLISANKQEEDSNMLGMIIGIIVGVILLICIIGGFIVFK